MKSLMLNVAHAFSPYYIHNNHVCSHGKNEIEEDGDHIYHRAFKSIMEGIYCECNSKKCRLRSEEGVTR